MSLKLHTLLFLGYLAGCSAPATAPINHLPSKTKADCIQIVSGTKKTYTASLPEGITQVRKLIQEQKQPLEDLWFVDGKKWYDVGALSQEGGVIPNDRLVFNRIEHSLEKTTYLVHNHPDFRIVPTSNAMKIKFFSMKKGNSGYKPPSRGDFLQQYHFQRIAEHYNKNLVGIVIDKEGVWKYNWKTADFPSEDLSELGRHYHYFLSDFLFTQQKMYTARKFSFPEEKQKLIQAAEQIGAELSFEKHR